MAIGAFSVMTAKPGSEDELLRRVTDVIADVRTEPGNLAAVLMRDPNEPGKIYLFSMYKDQAAIIEHREAAHSVQKGPAVRELFAEPMDARLFETID